MSPRNIKRDQRVREERIAQILNAAIQVISTQGIGASSMIDIAKAAGISIGNMYHYFKSKDDIFAEVLRQGQLNYGHNLTLLAKNTELNTYQILHQFACDWLDSPINWAYTIMLQTARTTVSVPHHIKQDVTDRFTINLEPMARIMKRGQSQGHVIDGDPLHLAFYFVSLIQGLTLQRAPGYEIPVSIDVNRIVILFCSH